MEPPKSPSFFRIALVASLLWTATLGGLFYWSAANEMQQCTDLASSQTRAFFQEFLMTRFWNAMHRGLYAPVTDKTKPNPYLEDDPHRDLETTSGITLTKLNPAYMTRQISAVASKRSEVQFHLTALDPINPANKADPWEAGVFKKLAGKDEFFELVNAPGGDKVFRYLSLMYVEEPCLECHAQYGDTLGDSCGGISVTVPAGPMVDLRNEKIGKLGFSYLLIWLVGLLSIGLCSRHISTRDRERTAMIDKLQRSQAEVKELSGMLPICCSCKNIRDDKGYWKRVEQYIGEHADIEFTHGICPDCAQKLYPDFCKPEGKQ